MNEIINFFKNLTTEQWRDIIFAIIIVIGFRIISSFISEIIIKAFSEKKKEKIQAKLNPFYVPLRTIITFIGIYISLNIFMKIIPISDKGVLIISKIVKILLIVLVAKAFGDWLSVKNGLFRKIKSKSNKDIDENTTKMIFRIVKVILYVFAGFMIISELGYNVTGFITGLGISGVVLTLAAQDTAKSLIGGIAIILDKPFKVGDFIRVGEYEGTVEDIKFRSTSIRTLDDNVVHVPNSEMAIMSILNYSEINTRRYNATFVLHLDTDLKKVHQFEKRVKNMLTNADFVVKEAVHVNLLQISDNGIDIGVMAYLHESQYYKFLNLKEKINYDIMRILEEENIELAYNTQTLYVKNES